MLVPDTLVLLKKAIRDLSIPTNRVEGLSILRELVKGPPHTRVTLAAKCHLGEEYIINFDNRYSKGVSLIQESAESGYSYAVMCIACMLKELGRTEESMNVTCLLGTKTRPNSGMWSV